MSVQKIKLDEILARTVAASEQKSQRKQDALDAWRAHEQQNAAVRNKTDKLRALRLAKEAEDAAAAAAAQVAAEQAKAAAPPRKTKAARV